MSTAICTINLSPNGDPEEQARWVVAFERKLDKLRAAHRASATPTLKVDAATQAIVDRFHAHSPVTADALDQVIHRLTEIGYTFHLPDTLVGSEPRTYLHADRADGTNAGYLNSKSIGFTHARSVAPASPLLNKRRVLLARDGAVDYIVQVAQAFAQAGN